MRPAGFDPQLHLSLHRRTPGIESNMVNRQRCPLAGKRHKSTAREGRNYWPTECAERPGRASGPLGSGHWNVIEGRAGNLEKGLVTGTLGLVGVCVAPNLFVAQGGQRFWWEEGIRGVENPTPNRAA